MEQINKIERSEVWNNIYEVLARFDLKDYEGDCLDRPSAATEIEQAVEKLLPIDGVSQQRELLIGLLTKLENGGGSAFIDKEQIVDNYLRGKISTGKATVGFLVFSKDDNMDMKEFYTVEQLTEWEGQTAQEKIESIFRNFNDTLRPGELPRIIKGIAKISFEDILGENDYKNLTIY